MILLTACGSRLCGAPLRTMLRIAEDALRRVRDTRVVKTWFYTALEARSIASNSDSLMRQLSAARLALA